MPKVALTDITVRTLKPGTYFDTKTPAFGIRVGKHRRTWIVLKGSRSDKHTIGHYPNVPLSQARKLALTELGSPYAPKSESISFSVASDTFIAEHYRDKAPRTKAEASRLLNRFSFHGPLDAIDDATLARELGKLSHVPSEQLHAFRVLRTMLRWCTRPPYRYIRHSPLEGFAAPSTDRQGTRILSDKELTKIWKACEGSFGAMVRLLILWGTRNGETGRLRRDWIENDVLTIPAAFTKNDRPHSIPILPMARAILDKRPHHGPYYFPGHYDFDTHFKDGSWGKLKNELSDRAGVKDWQLRDIRRTFRSGMAKLSVSREVGELLLNHVTGAGWNQLDEIYNRHSYLEEKRDALTRWEKHIQLLVA